MISICPDQCFVSAKNGLADLSNYSNLVWEVKGLRSRRIDGQNNQLEVKCEFTK